MRQAIHSALTEDLLNPPYRDKWRPENPTYGHCALASEAAWFILGGKEKGWVAMVGHDGIDGNHWWLENRITGERFDPTREQYDLVGSAPPYERGVVGTGVGFMGIRVDEDRQWGLGYRPSLRAQVVLRRMMTSLYCQGVQELREKTLGVDDKRAKAGPGPRARNPGPGR